MADPGPLLVVETSTGRYAFPADRVRRVVWLPVLSHAPEPRTATVGMAHLEDTTVPVVDLDLALGRVPEPYSVDHRMLDLEANGHRLAVVVAEVGNVVEPEAGSFEENGPEAVIGGFVRAEGVRVPVLDTDRLASPEARESMPEFDTQQLFADLDEDELREMGRRQRELTTEPGPGLREGQRAGAIVDLGGRLAALPLDQIRGFARIGNLAPVPFTPDHVLGLANHEGEIVPVVDLGTPGARGGDCPATAMAAVVDLPEGPTGIALRAVQRTVTLDEAELTDGESGDPARLGSIPHAGEPVEVLDPVRALEAARVAVEHEV